MRWLFIVTCVFNTSFCFSQTESQLKFAQFNQFRVQHNLGLPRQESQGALQCPAPKNYGWWQAFDKAWVYYTPATNFVMVNEPVFSKWAETGWEQGALGFPTSNAYTVNTDHTINQQFEGGKIVHYIDMNTTQVEYSQKVLPAGRYQLILCGFKVEQETRDNPLEWDGKGDEIFFRLDFSERDGFGTTRKDSMTTMIFGDINRGAGAPGPKIKAGSRSSQGGLKTEDWHPSATPWLFTGLQANDLPMKIWEGQIDHMHRLLFTPSVWEWDEEKRSAVQNKWAAEAQQIIPTHPFWSTDGVPGFDGGMLKDREGTIPLVRMYNLQVNPPVVDYYISHMTADHRGLFFNSGFSDDMQQHPNNVFSLLFYNSIEPFGRYRVYFKLQRMVPTLPAVKKF